MTSSNQIRFQAVTQEQVQALENSAHNLLLWGPGGSGKSQVLAVKSLIKSITVKNNRIFLIRRKKVDLRQTLWKRFSDMLPESVVSSHDNNSMYFKLKTNNTEIYGLGLDTVKDVNKLASAECSMAVVEEATELPEEYLSEKIQRSIRLPGVKFHQLLMACNPDNASHYLRQRFILNPVPGYESICMPTIPESAGILPHTFYTYLAELTGVFAQRYRDGKWVTIEGVVYPYDPTHHKISQARFMKLTGARKEGIGWIFRGGKIVRSVDFGYDHPFVCQWWYVSPGDVWYLFRQIYITQRRVDSLGKDIYNFSMADRINNNVNTDIEVICDHDAENMADLRNCGLITIPAKKERLAGQQSVQKLFDTDRIFFVEDNLVELDTRLQMRKAPTCTEEEFPLYVWAAKGKEDMCKIMDDGCDTTRYAIHTTATSEGQTVDFNPLDVVSGSREFTHKSKDDLEGIIVPGNY